MLSHQSGVLTRYIAQYYIIFILSPAAPIIYRYNLHPVNAATTCSGSGYFCAKKAPVDHISVKDRGLLLLDFNQVWGDGTTFSFYWVSVPFQIFNYPRGI